MLYYKVHDSYRKVVAVCDADLAGKRFEEGKRQLDVRESFYKDQEASVEEMVELFRKFAEDDSTFNIVGPRAVGAAIDAGIITKDHTSSVDGVLFALLLL